MAKHSRYQEKIIKNYYRNRDSIAVQRLQELVTELYLAEGKARIRHWKSVSKHLAALEVKQEQIDYWVEQDNPELVANFVRDLVSQGK